MGQPKLPLTYKRRMQTERVLRAGCHVCHGDTAYWTAANAQALAAQHHDRTTHATWVEIGIKTEYGRITADPRQIDIEDAIASASNPTSSGDRPGSAPLPSPDAPAIPTADVSAPPKAALSKRALAAAKPEQTHV